MAKDKNKKQATKRAKVTKAVQSAGKKAAKIASNPAVTEVVAASLVAAAAALRDPRKARDIATVVGAELETASKQAIDRGNAFWQLALDIAKRSIDAIGGDKRGKKAKGKGKATSAGKAKAAGKTKAAAKAKPATKAKAATKAKTVGRAKPAAKSKPAAKAKPRAKAKAPAKRATKK